MDTETSRSGVQRNSIGAGGGTGTDTGASGAVPSYEGTRPASPFGGVDRRSTEAPTADDRDRHNRRELGDVPQVFEVLVNLMLAMRAKEASRLVAVRATLLPSFRGGK
jgi:hypothetical protein